eukprot:2642472-Rhodomonas_salina.6
MGSRHSTLGTPPSYCTAQGTGAYAFCGTNRGLCGCQESLDNAELRQQQLRVAFGALVRSVGDAAQRQARCNADVKTGFTPEQSSGAGAIGAGAGAGAGAGEGSGEGGLGGGSDEGGGGVKGRAQMGVAVLLGTIAYAPLNPWPPFLRIPSATVLDGPMHSIIRPSDMRQSCVVLRIPLCDHPL